MMGQGLVYSFKFFMIFHIFYEKLILVVQLSLGPDLGTLFGLYLNMFFFVGGVNPFGHFLDDFTYAY